MGMIHLLVEDPLGWGGPTWVDRTTLGGDDPLACGGPTWMGRTHLDGEVPLGWGGSTFVGRIHMVVCRRPEDF